MQRLLPIETLYLSELKSATACFTMTYDVVQISDADTMLRFDPATFWSQFRHGTIAVEGVRLHFVEGGSGSPILLVPGRPQSWFAWRYVIPLLVAAGRRVISVDPRGVGDSDRPACPYALGTAAAELHEFVQTLGLTTSGPHDVVGHDVGTWIGYAFAADWAVDVKRLALFEAALPGFSPPPAPGIPSVETNVKTWHFAFNRLDDLPEVLFQGRERETGVGTALIDTMRLVANDVHGGVFQGCGHYMPEEAPRAVAEQIIRFMEA